MADSHEYDLIEHTKLTFEEATPEFFAAEAKKHNKAPCAIIVDDYMAAAHPTLAKFPELGQSRKKL